MVFYLLSLAIVVSLYLYLTCREASFVAERVATGRGEYLVKVTCVKGVWPRNSLCVLDKSLHFSSGAVYMQMLKGHTSNLSYTPSLADDHPGFVVVHYEKWRMSKSMQVDIV